MIERFAPGAGGVEKVAWRVAHELARAGEDVTVVTRKAEPETPRPVDLLAREVRADAGVRVERIRVPNTWQPLRVLAFSHAAAAATGRGRFDVVHSFSRTRHQDLFRAGGGSHAEYLRHTHGRAGEALRRLSPRHRVLLSMEARVFDDPKQRIQCASRFVSNALIHEHGVAPDRILLLPNAVDADRYGGPEALAAGRRLRAELDAKAERVWLFPASGWRRKGLSVLLDAMARTRDPGMRLWIAGRDDPRPWRRRVARLELADRVRFLGPRGDLETIYGAVDGMVLPTRYDAFANVTLEAAASGLPVITTRANGAAEWLSEDVQLLEDADDAVELSQALGSFADPERRRALGDRARRTARGLDWARHVSQLRDEYRRQVRARSDRRDR